MSEQAASTDDWLTRGRKHLRRREYVEAEECFQTALAANPHDPVVHEALATAAFVVKDYEKAAHFFREASRCDSRRADPLINLGAVLNKLSKFKEATEALQKGLVKSRTSPEAYYNLGIAYRGSGNAAMAVSAYKEAIRLRPEFAEAHQNLGNAFLDQNNRRQAVSSFTRALELNPDLKGAAKGLKKANSVETAPRTAPSAMTQTANVASGVSAPPVVLTEIQRAADREVVNEGAKRLERAVLALQSELQSQVEPAVKKLAKSLMNDALSETGSTITKLSVALSDVEQIMRLRHEARVLLAEHEEDLLNQA